MIIDILVTKFINTACDFKKLNLDFGLCLPYFFINHTFILKKSDIPKRKERTLVDDVMSKEYH